MNSCRRRRFIGFARFGVVRIVLLLPLLAPILKAAEPAATQPAEPMAGQIRRLMDDPRDRDQYPAFRDQKLQDVAWPIFEAAVRDTKSIELAGGFFRTGKDSAELLCAMAAINPTRAGPLVLDMSQSPALMMREDALGLFDLKLGVPPAQMIAINRKALSDPIGRIVQVAIENVAKLNDIESGPAALEILRHAPKKKWRTMENTNRPHGELFTVALETIGKLPYVEASGDLVQLLADPYWEVRTAATRALARCIAQDPDAPRRAAEIESIAVLLDDPNKHARSAAALALAELRDRRAGPQLAYDIQAEGIFDPAKPPDHYLQLIDPIQAIEKLTGADYGSSLGRDAWNIAPSASHPELSTPIVERVRKILADLKSRGITPDGLPHVPEKLTGADRQLLDSWLDHWLIDPRSGKLIHFNYPERTCWRKVAEGSDTGCLFPAEQGKPARLVLADGRSMPIPAKYETIDFIEDARKGGGPYVGPCCAQAAWLYRLGEEKLAAKMLYLSRGATDRLDGEVERTREDYAWDAFSFGVNAYIVRDDDDALAALQHLRKLYPDYLEEFGPGEKLIEELNRRKQEGIFIAHAPPATLPTTQKAEGFDDGDDHQVPFAPPAEFSNWPPDRQAAWQILDLQEFDEPQQGQPGGVDVSSGARVEALIKIGEPAVPALIDCIDHDERLTRSCSFWRNFAKDRSIVSVRECALSAAESILGTSVFEPACSGDNFTRRGEETAHQTAQQLRAYWAKYGKLPYPQRMMTILTDPTVSTSATTSAASALAHLMADRRFSTMMVWNLGANPKPGESPVIKQFNQPTVAEAILAALDRGLARIDAEAADRPENNRRNTTDDFGYDRSRLKSTYADLLIALQDRRIAPALLLRFQASAGNDDARKWATACYSLGEERPLMALAQEFKRGQVLLGRIDPLAKNLLNEPGMTELKSWLWFFEQIKSPFCDEAILSLADPAQPYQAAAAMNIRRQILTHGFLDFDSPWTRHRVLFQIARPMLDDTQLTGISFRVAGDHLDTEYYNGHDGKELIESLKNPSSRHEEAKSRVCDQIAMCLGGYLIGAPEIHPLFKDSDTRMKAFRDFIDQYAIRLRPLPYAWGERDFDEFADSVYYPDLLIAGRLATAEDVAAHRAIFCLPDPGGKPDPRKLPLLAKLAIPQQPPEPVLILQAERDARGRMHYGILARHQIREASEQEISDIKSVDGK